MDRRFLHGLIICLLVPLLVITESRAADGHFEVVRAEARLVDGVWHVDGRASFELSQAAREALSNGIVLTLAYQFEVDRQRALWPDEQVLRHTHAVRLRYLSLSDRYIVEYPSGAEPSNFATLSAALRDIGNLQGVPLIATDKLQPGERYVVAIRAVLDQEGLPGPLQLLTFWRGDYSLGSRWYRWTLPA